MRRQPSNSTTRALATLGVGAVALYGARVLIDFFGSTIPYAMPSQKGVDLTSPDFIRFLSIITDGTVRPSRITRLRDGVEFYPAALDRIRRAKHSINIEFYEFLPGEVASTFLQALTERARAGVQVRIIVDAIGSFLTPLSLFDDLRAAGGKMRWYHPIRWNTWPQINNRTHRKLIVIDGDTGFLGGAGIADHWLHATRKGPAWRDTMLYIEGDAVAGLLSAFSENWLESSGEILSGKAQFVLSQPPPDDSTNNPPHNPAGVPSFIVSSTPHGGGTQARILFQALLKSAQRSIRITTPYFLPDRSARHAMVQAVGRGVKVEILTAGPRIDHPVIRKLSRHSSRHLLQGGASIFEYQPAMIHAKLLTVDGLWSVAGSTNFDHRSFALNDEVNLAVLDPQLAQTLEADFTDDLRHSRPLTLPQLAQRTLLSTGEDILDRLLSEES